MNNLPCFTAWSVLFIMAWAASNLSPAIPHFEKQFGLNSKQTAVVLACADISGLSVMLFVSYIGTKLNKAKGMAIGAFFYAVGSLIETVPHWMSAAPIFETVVRNRSVFHPELCPLEVQTLNNTSDKVEAVAGDYTPYAIMVLGELMRGLGTTSIFTLGTSYIDENGKYPTTAIFICVTYTASSLGVGVGSMLGGWIMDNVYVDFDRVEHFDVPSGPKDPNWIGAWWLLFLGASIFCFISCIPIYGYPKYLPGFGPNKTSNDRKKSEDQEGEVELRGKTILQMMKNIVKDFFKAFLRLVRNLEFMLLSVSTAVAASAAIGMGMFSFKYLTEQYDLSFQAAGYIMASKSLFSAVAFMLGGTVIRRFKLHALGIERLSFALSLASALVSLGMLARCPNVQLSGVEISYSGQSTTSSLLSQCQAPCQCQCRAFNPVCGADDNVYYSPCHAGCKNEMKLLDKLIYTNCSCIEELQDNSESENTAHQGLCDTGCFGVYISTPFTFIMMLFVVISIANENIATLRCVDQDLRPFALGVQWVIMRLLGNIPSPVFVGSVIDSVCLVWSDPVPGKGSRYCQVYDKERLAYGFCFMWMMANLISGCLFLAASVVNVRKNKNKELANGNTQMTEKEEQI